MASSLSRAVCWGSAYSNGSGSRCNLSLLGLQAYSQAVIALVRIYDRNKIIRFYYKTNERVVWQGGFETKTSFDFGKQYMYSIMSLHSVYQFTVIASA